MEIDINFLLKILNDVKKIFFYIWNYGILNSLKNDFIGSIVSIGIIYQIRIFLKEYKIKHSIKVTPYFEILNYGPNANDCNFYFNLRNDSFKTIHNLQIILDNNFLSCINLTDWYNTNNLNYIHNLHNNKDITILKDKEFSIFLCSLKNIDNLDVFKSKTLKLTINFYKDNQKQIFKSDSHSFDLERMAGLISLNSNKEQIERQKLKQLVNLNDNYLSLLKHKLILYYETFGEFFPDDVISSTQTIKIIKEIDKCFYSKSKFDIEEFNNKKKDL